MPKKKEQVSPEEQVRRFEAEVQRLIDAGELKPTEADERFERVMSELLGRSSKR
jgi:hypothetical protein